MASTSAHPPAELTCSDRRLAYEKWGITLRVRMIGSLLARHPGLYDVLDAFIELGYQRWPFGRNGSGVRR
ncbi:uncharacterized protein RMCN_4712 [Mycolicibacterium novocastrense]|uniref:Uncharacterized protein n=1 Tax=Mycolicibacterium novocastrense TaxID=59813 RepID=A0ABQ0KPL8_MYCNV|nr:uncharacterized protein RMCN_4712 [Mycolicibacterium novocastrense]